MLQVPENFWLTSGVAEGETELNAFDNALLLAGIGKFNLIKVSSILPAGAQLQETGPPSPAGAIVPVVLATAVSAIPGEHICSCVGVGRSKDSHGIIMEYSGRVSAFEAERVIRKMLSEAFDRRGLTLDDVLIKCLETDVKNICCTVAAVVLW